MSCGKKQTNLESGNPIKRTLTPVTEETCIAGGNDNNKEKFWYKEKGESAR